MQVKFAKRNRSFDVLFAAYDMYYVDLFSGVTGDW